MAILDRFRKKDQEDKTSAASAASDAKKTPSKKSQPKKQSEAKAETLVGVTSAGDHLSTRLLLKPHVSEKAARLADKGTYVFDVVPEAEKVAIKKAVEALYGVQVASVHTVRGKGKSMSRGNRIGRRKQWKKALVTVKKGERIDLYEGV